MTTRTTDLILASGLLSARPAAADAPAGALYPATDTQTIYRNTGSAWADWYAAEAGLTAEAVRDLVAGLLQPGYGIAIANDDAGDEVEISTTVLGVIALEPGEDVGDVPAGTPAGTLIVQKS